jgi:phosphatidylglycerophosphatase A
MSEKTEPPPSESPESSSPAANARPKPVVAYLIATVLGLGYLPYAPGTWGSLGGIVLAVAPWWVIAAGTGVISAESGQNTFEVSGRLIDPFFVVQVVIAIGFAAIGVWSANRVSTYEGRKDPQHVVIDEVSGQHLTVLLGCGLPVWWRPEHPWIRFPVGLVTIHAALSWKYLLLGFILFRVFDVWKPFPARHAESLRGGWGIMADDWIAGVYAGVGLWVARAAGL